MRRPGCRPAVSETELAVLKALWRRGAATVRELDGDLRRDGRRWAYNTVLTLLQRLQAKGYVRSDKSAPAHVYSPAVTREEHLRLRLRELADAVCEGAATPLVRAMVDGGRFSQEEIAELRDLIERLDADVQPRKGKGGERS
jgi:predicted transcriptional regulator